MSVYEKNGNQISHVYDVSGTMLNQAYDIDRNPLLQNESNFTVMSYNVQWFSGLNSNKSMQESILAEYNADIIGLQELGSSMPSLGAELLSAYQHITLGSQYNKTGMASKYSLENVVSASFTHQDGETRGYQKAHFTALGKNICWVNTHLETSSHEAAKVAQAQEVFELVQDEPYFIITGDFNTVCKSVYDTEYNTIMKQFIDAGYNSANCSAQHGFIDTWTSGSTASGTWYPCDHVITSANISINNVIADTTKIEVAAQTGQSIDHLPLIAYLTIN